MNLYVQGDVSAFDELYKRHKSKVYGYLVKKLSSKEAAEEVFQTAFLKLHQSLNLFKDGEAFLPWLFSIARNSLFDYLRKSRSEDHKIEALQSENAHSTQSIDNPQVEELENNLAKLSDQQRELLKQRYVEGLDFEEIARRAQSSPEATRQSISRVTRKLKNLLKGNS